MCPWCFAGRELRAVSPTVTLSPTRVKVLKVSLGIQHVSPLTTLAMHLLVDAIVLCKEVNGEEGFNLGRGETKGFFL